MVGGNESVVVEAIQLQLNILLVELSKLKKQGRAIENWLEELSQQQQNTIEAKVIEFLLGEKSKTER